MQHIDIKEIFVNQELLNNNVTVCGWVRTARDSKNVAFIELNDGTSLKHLQIVIEKDSGIELEQCLKLGTALKVEGKLVPSANNIVEINASSIEVLGTAPADYPLQKKRHTLEFLRTMPHLRLRTNTFNAVFRVRSVMAAAIHEFFQSKNFVYVNPPLITGSDCEGAGEMFQVTTIGYQDGKYKSAEEYYADDFFGKKAGLSVSAQLEGETAALAMGKIYTFGPSFRAENSNTPKHLAEFWHVEPEVAFAELPDVIALAEEMVKFVIGRVLEKCPQEMQFFDKFMENGLIERLTKLISEDFGTITYTEAIELLKKADVEFQYPVEWGCDLQTEHERYISEKIFNKAVFVTNYPKEIKSFYMKQNSDGKTVAAVDLLVPGVGEIIGGSEREADYDKLLEAMKVRNMPLEPYADYLDLRKYGSVPHGGFGLGFERLIMYVTGMANIRDVVLYPRTVNNIR
ncbi:MAG: asparagine--tRNA ligase [Clostridiales bacterium]|nr:asparagine--tRNA ligase [Clostridiales bacterium]